MIKQNPFFSNLKNQNQLQINGMISIVLILNVLLLGTFQLAIKKAAFYSNDKKIEYVTNLLTHSQLFKKETCKNDATYFYLKVGSQKAKYSGTIMCNIHARQLIASQICLKWLDMIGSQTQILSKMNFNVFYRANNMRDYARTEEGQCDRKNKFGVDINRNFPTQFNFYKAKPESQIYPGLKPIDQSFSICLNQTITKRLPDFFLDIHSGQSAFYYQEGINNDKEVEMLKNLNSSFPDMKLQKITTLKKDGQSINGHIFADLKFRLQVPYSFLFETYNGQKHKTAGQKIDQSEHCFGFFNPTTSQELSKQKQTWSKVMMSLTKQVISALDNQNKK